MPVTLNREAATALLTEARRDFENGAHELLSGDESQRPTIDACTEIIGRLNWNIDRDWWPQENPPAPFTAYDKPQVEFEFTQTAIEWMERTETGTSGFIADLERDGEGDEGGIAEANGVSA